MNRIRGVSIDFIDSLNESAKSTYPDEFICLHREHDGVIDELVMLPGTIFGDSHSVIFDWMDPVDFHRSHFITCQPYDRHSWRAYNSAGEPIHLDMLYADGTVADV